MKRLLSTFLAATLTVLSGSPLGAQEEAPFSATVDVRVINIDVVVTDRKGNPINGLTMNDFVVLENGKPQNVTNFYEVRYSQPAPAPAAPAAVAQAPAAAPEEIPPHLRRRIVFFIDNLSLAPFNRNRVFKAMKDFAKEALRPGDEAMVATWNRSLKVRVPFTSDANQIQQALDSIAGESALGLQVTSDRRHVESQIRDARSIEAALGLARSYAQTMDHDLRQTVYAVNGLLSTLAGVDGKKILVLTSEGFHMQPGREMFHYVESMRREKPDWGQGGGSTLFEGMHYNASHLIQSVASSANANAVTLYTLHAGGLMGMTESNAENSRAIPLDVQNAAVTNSTDSLMLLADMTGGLAAVGTNNFNLAFDRIERDLSSYYSIGYRSATERVDRQRSVDVRLRNNNRKYIVRARQTFVEKSITSEMTDRVIANLFYETKTNDLGIFVSTGRPTEREDGNFEVPVEVHIPFASLTLLPQGQIHAGGFSLFVVASDTKGDMSDVSQKTHTLRFEPSELAALEGKHFTYELELVVAKGRNKISIGVVDEATKTTGFARQEVLALNL